ncbi:NAD-dependent malic enzyme [Candidatus Peregrinibacteria bacterium CG_4_10_14_0_2_um_filter_43_11]|nr:MAG: NAD-dependent malic enzyme [Candidatus Peregrinibacteria bacterium CG_4_10_14_0_2_um_filter_43_11]
MDYYAESLKLHEEHRGKIEVISKVPLKTRDDLSLAYTPGVAEPCMRIHQNPSDVYKYTNKGNMVAVVSDGSAVLGLGNIGGAAGMPVMEGKAILFKEFGGVDAFPICLDTQDVDEIVATVQHIAPTFGGINLEDISAPRCFEIEQRLIEALDIPVFHDDQHGTAIVVLAGLINALKLTNRKLENTRIVVNGVGAAGVAITKLLIRYGADPKKMLLCDSRGAIYLNRDHLNPIKEKLAKITNVACKLGTEHPDCKTGGLSELMEGADVFIGVSQPKLVTSEMIKSMAKDPIVFAMANPEPEIMPDVAKKAGATIVATGRSDFPNQINNVLAFPGLFRGVLDARIKRFTDEIKILAAEAIAGYVKKPTADEIIPSTLDRGVAKALAETIKSMTKK